MKDWDRETFSLVSRPIQPDTTCYASGWGGTKQILIFREEDAANELQAVKLKVESDEVCENTFKELVSGLPVFPTYVIPETNITLKNASLPFRGDYELCTKAVEKGVCQGDSGGPLICEGLYLYDW